MSIRRRRRGISLGTFVTVSLCIVTLLAGMLIFSRISGDISDITIDPKLLAEPLTVFARSVTDTDPAPLASPESTSLFTLAEATQQASTPAPTATPEPTPPPNRTLTLTAVGQVSIGTELRANAASGTQGHDFYDILSPIAGALANADLSIVTLRTGLSASAGNYGPYCAPSTLIDSFRATGVNMFNFATDRILDHGMSGIDATRTVMEGKGSYFSGIYRTQEERSHYAVVDIDGVKVGLLAYTSHLSAAGKSAASAAEAAIATRVLSPQEAAANITALRANGADVVIVLAHWGNRSDTKPSKETLAEVDALIAAGADVILGTNPTSVHEIERRNVTDPYGEKREVFIAYSLGNFLVDDSRDTANITGVVLHLNLEWNAATRRASIGEAWYMPTWIMRWRDNSGTNRYRVVPAGTTTIPEGMTESIYINMKKSYQAIVDKLGDAAAQPRPQ